MNVFRRWSSYLFSKGGLYSYFKKHIKAFLRLARQLVKRSVIKRNLDVKFISNDFGFGRGIPVDRYSMHTFFCKYGHFITNTCLEFGDTTYIDKYGAEVSEKVTFNYSNNSSCLGGSLSGDITKLNTLPSEAFDCIVCINVLNFIYEISDAVLGLKKMLKPNGKVLLTLAGVSSHISRYDMDRWGDYWRLTDKAAIKLLEKSGLTIDAMQVYGNPYACAAQLNGFSIEDLVQSELTSSHRDYQLVLAFTLSKLIVEDDVNL